MLNLEFRLNSGLTTEFKIYKIKSLNFTLYIEFMFHLLLINKIVKLISLCITKYHKTSNFKEYFIIPHVIVWCCFSELYRNAQSYNNIMGKKETLLILTSFFFFFPWLPILLDLYFSAGRNSGLPNQSKCS